MSGEDVPAQLQSEVVARVAARADGRHAKIALLQEPGGIARADDPARVATRIDRLARFHADVRPINPAAVAAEEPDATAAASAVLERILVTNDLLGVGYLEGGVAAARPVGRVVIRDGRGRLIGYGTGSLVSPELLLTNHHVLTDAATAATSSVEFDYQEGPDGQACTPVPFPLDPARFFIADERLDFALVAVQATPAQLAPYGFNQLYADEGKAIVGDFVTIIQHPGGRRKQVALRENRIVDVLDLFLHYATDTEAGSSGSPVFNDQWEVVALHHAAVPAPEHGEFGGYVNEGTRVSQLLAFLRAQPLPPEHQALLHGLNATPGESAPVVTSPAPPVPAPPVPAHTVTASALLADLTAPAAAPPRLVLTVPFDVRLRGDLLDASPREPAGSGPEILIVSGDAPDGQLSDARE